MRLPQPSAACRRVRLPALVVGLVIFACTRPIPPESVARPVARPDSAVAWWQALEACSGKSGDLAAVTWLSVRGYVVVIDGLGYDGFWLQDRNAVVFGEDRLSTANRAGHLIRHELLHALLQRGDHPTEFFGRKCRELLVPNAKGRSTLPNRRCCRQARGVAAAAGGLILGAEPPSAAAIVDSRLQQNAIRYAERRRRH